MRSLEKNKRKLYYALYNDKIPNYERDEDGNIIYIDDGEGNMIPVESGNYSVGYELPVSFMASLSAGRGSAQSEVFGTGIDFTRSISTTELLPIDEQSLIWYETTPTYNTDGTVNSKSADYKVAAPIADGLNSYVIALKKLQKNEVS